MQKEVLKQFGQRLKEIRNSKGLSQEQLSHLTDIDRSYISDVERGLRNIALENITILATALEIPVYQLFLGKNNILERWDIHLFQLEDLVLKNPSLRGFLIGYLAEAKIRELFAQDKRISALKKFDDHDRANKHDLVITYKGGEYSFEIKSLQTATVKKAKIGSINLEARFQCDASDRRKIKLGNGQEIETTCLKFGEFDIIAVNLFAFREKWEFAFALNQDLPSSDYKKYPEEVRKSLIKSLIPITLPLQTPFVADPFLLLEHLHKARESS
jgi:transcriptional regulator with XRE-family HTH domain